MSLRLAVAAAAVAGALGAFGAIGGEAHADELKPVRGEVGFDVTLGSLAGWDSSIGGGLSFHVGRRSGALLVRGELTAGIAGRGTDPADPTKQEEGTLQQLAAVAQYSFKTWAFQKAKLSFHLYAEGGAARQWIGWDGGEADARTVWIAGGGADYFLHIGEEGGRARVLRAFLGARVHGTDGDKGVQITVGFTWGW